MTEPIAEGITTLEGLMLALKLRRQKLGASQWLIDEISGLQRGYTFKLEKGLKGLGKLALPLLCDTLGVEIALIETGYGYLPAAGRHVGKPAISTNYAHCPKKKYRELRGRLAAQGGRARMRQLKKAERRALSSKGGKGRARSLSKVRRSEIAQAAVKARWAKAKVTDLLPVELGVAPAVTPAETMSE